MGKIGVYCEAEKTADLWKKTNYNLKNDLKDIDEDELNEIAVEIGNEIENGLDRPTATAIYWGNKRRANYAKIRIIDEKRDTGKSGGYRCIVLVDYVNDAAFLLHIYRHSQGRDNELTARDKVKLRKLVDEYIDALGKQ